MTTNIRRFTTAIAAPAALLFALAACGGAERPTVDEITESLKSGGAGELTGLSGREDVLSDEAYTCVAEVIHDSDLENETLVSLVEGDEDAEVSDEETDKVSGLQSTLMEECADVIAEGAAGQ